MESSILSKRKEERVIILSILIGTFLIPVNSTMIAVGLPTIAGDFDIGIDNVAWVVTVYLIIMAVLQPITGKLGDLYGKRTVYLIGMLLFLAASVLCIFAINVTLLILFRAFQALGGALLSPNAMAIIREVVPSYRLAQTLGTYGLLMGLGAAIGPLIGAFLISVWGWPAIFLINIPFALFSLFVAYMHLPKSSKRSNIRLDIYGAFYLALGFSILIFLVTNPHWYQLWVVILFALILFLFIRTELRHPEPIIQFRLFTNIAFSSANIAILLSNAIMYSTLLLMPILLQSGYDFSLQAVGMLLFIYSLAMSASSWLGGKLTKKIGAKVLIFLSFIIANLALGGYLAISWYPSLVFVGATLVVGGIGAGVGLSSMQVTSLQSVPVETAGVAAGIYSTFRYIGGIAAAVLVSVILDARVLIYCLIAVAIMGVMIAFGVTVGLSERSNDLRE